MVGEDSLKASFEIFGASPRKAKAVKLVQFQKAFSPMLVTPLPIVMLFRLVQPEKAPASMLVTLSGML